MMRVKHVLSGFVYSRFYRWSRTVVWIAAVLIIANSDFYRAITTLKITLVYTIVPSLLMRITEFISDFSREHPTQAKIEKYMETSPMITYLKTLLEDVQKFNEDHKDGGVQFHLAEIDLVSGGIHTDRHSYELYESSLKLHTRPVDDRNFCIKSYKDIIASWYPGSCPKSKEELESDFSDCFRYDKDGYVAKNEAFRRELQKVSVDDFKLWSHDDINSYIFELHSFFDVSSNLFDIVIASKAIKACFKDVHCRRIGTDEYHNRAYGYYYHIVITIPRYL